MTKKLLLAAFSLVVLAGTNHFANAGDFQESKTMATPDTISLFHQGGMELELRGGALFSFGSKGGTRPKLNYALETGRIGIMLNDVHWSGFLRGNEELLLEVFGGEVTKGPRTAFGGGMLIVRHNFVQPGSHLIPYLEVGAGGLYDDIYHHQEQHLIGGPFEFMLHGGAGLRWMINDRWGLSLEGDYRHISNANIYSRNAGLNSVGATLGVTWFF